MNKIILLIGLLVFSIGAHSASIELITEGTIAATSAPFKVIRSGGKASISISPVANLTAGEYAHLQESPDCTDFPTCTGATWNAINSFGTTARLHSENTKIHIKVIGTYRVVLDDPTGSVGVYFSHGDNL